MQINRAVTSWQTVWLMIIAGLASVAVHQCQLPSACYLLGDSIIIIILYIEYQQVHAWSSPQYHHHNLWVINNRAHVSTMVQPSPQSILSKYGIWCIWLNQEHIPVCSQIISQTSIPDVDYARLRRQIVLLNLG